MPLSAAFLCCVEVPLPRLIEHVQNQGFILLPIQAAKLHGSDADSEGFQPTLCFVIQGHCEMMYTAVCSVAPHSQLLYFKLMELSDTLKINGAFRIF